MAEEADVDGMSPSASSQSNGSPQSSFTSQSSPNSPIHGEKNHTTTMNFEPLGYYPNDTNAIHHPEEQTWKQYPAVEITTSRDHVSPSGSTGSTSNDNSKSKRTYKKVHDKDLQGPFNCRWSGCNEVAETPELLYDHLCDAHVGRKASNNLSLTCKWENCGISTVKRDHITSHIRVHVPLKPFHCSVCPKSFKRPQDLKKHLRIHSEEHARRKRGAEEQSSHQYPAYSHGSPIKNEHSTAIHPAAAPLVGNTIDSSRKRRADQNHVAGYILNDFFGSQPDQKRGRYGADPQYNLEMFGKLNLLEEQLDINHGQQPYHNVAINNNFSYGGNLQEAERFFGSLSNSIDLQYQSMHEHNNHQNQYHPQHLYPSLPQPKLEPLSSQYGSYGYGFPQVGRQLGQNYGDGMVSMDFGGVSGQQKSGKKLDEDKTLESFEKLTLDDAKVKEDAKKSDFDVDDVLKHKALVDIVLNYLKELRESKEQTVKDGSTGKLYPTITAF